MQLVTLCSKLHIRSTSCGQDTDNIRKCLISGLFKNVAVLQKDKSYSTVRFQTLGIIIILYSRKIYANDFCDIR